MRNVSDAYLVAINSDSEQTQFLATFGFVPPGSREGATMSSYGFGQLWGNRLEQLNNRSLGMGGKWNTLELNRSVLGGGGEYIDQQSTRQTGDWSTSQSNASGVFISPPYIEMTLDKAYDLIGIQIIFDDLGEEWATEVKIGYYNSSYALISERTLPNNMASMSVDWQYNGVRRIRITINKWNLPRRFAKVCQLIPGQIRYFTDDNTYSFVMKEKISPFESLTMPEYTITFANENQEYNIINPHGLIAKLREKMEIPSSIGLVTSVGIEYINTGNFPLFSWPSNVSEDMASFVCRPDIAFANNDYIGSLGAKITLDQAATNISTQAGLATTIFIDPSMRGIIVNANIGENVPIINALGQLAIAAGGYLKFERDGTYSIKPIIYGTPVKQIDYSGMWEEASITQEIMLAGIRVKYMIYDTWNSRMRNVEELVTTNNQIGRIIDVSSGFIASIEDAKRIGNIAIDFFSHRLSYSFSYRGDMSIEAGDIISVETDYGFRKVLVIEHEISYNSSEFLQGKIYGIEI